MLNFSAYHNSNFPSNKNGKECTVKGLKFYVAYLIFSILTNCATQAAELSCQVIAETAKPGVGPTEVNPKISIFTNDRPPTSDDFSVKAVLTSDRELKIKATVLPIKGDYFSDCETRVIKKIQNIDLSPGFISVSCYSNDNAEPKKNEEGTQRKLRSLSIHYARAGTYESDGSRWSITEAYAWIDIEGDEIRGLGSARSVRGDYVCY